MRAGEGRARKARAHLENCTGKERKEERERKRGARKPLRGLRRRRRGERRSSKKERRVDAKALIAEEGRDKLRKAMGSRK